MECRQFIIEKASLLKEHVNTLKINHQSPGTWRLAAPYFKTKKLYQCPPNEDILKKKRNNELIVYDLWPVVKWSDFECEKVIKAVKMNYTFNKQRGSKSKMKKNLDEKKLSETDLEIPPLNSNDHIDWGRISSVFVQGIFLI